MLSNRRHNSKLGILFAMLVILYPVRALTADEVKTKFGKICTDFVELLIEDDYRAFIELEYVGYDIVEDCEGAHKQELENPVYLFGYAKTLELSNPITDSTRNRLDHAVKLLRKAASFGYEPAIFQLFRYMGSQGNLEDPFLRTRYSLRYRINDESEFYIDKLENSKSLRIRDFVLGFLVNDYSRPKLAAMLAENNIKEGSVKAKFYFGMMQTGGLGVVRNIEKGIAKIRDAAIQGDLLAQVTYAHLAGPGIYTNPQIPDANFKETYKLLVNAVNNGHKFGFGLLDSYLKTLVYDIGLISGEEWESTRRVRDELVNIVSCNLDTRFKKMSYFYNFIKICYKNGKL